MAELSLVNFRKMWKENVSELENKCDVWQDLMEDETVPDDVRGQIRTAIGLAKLLIRQKLKQFNGLIDDSEFKTGEKEITLEDLQGFWDMVYVEVEKIQKSFTDLENCQQNDWKAVEIEKKSPKKRVPKKVAAKKPDTNASHAQAAKQRLAEIKKKMLAQRIKEAEDKMAAENEANDFAPASEDRDTVVEHEKPKTDVPSPSKIAKTKTTKAAKANKENVTQNITPASKVKKTKAKKEVLKLQCLTRSAKKALLAKQNGEKAS